MSQINDVKFYAIQRLNNVVSLSPSHFESQPSYNEFDTFDFPLFSILYLTSTCFYFGAHSFLSFGRISFTPFSFYHDLQQCDTKWISTEPSVIVVNRVEQRPWLWQWQVEENHIAFTERFDDRFISYFLIDILLFSEWIGPHLFDKKEHSIITCLSCCHVASHIQALHY